MQPRHDLRNKTFLTEAVERLSASRYISLEKLWEAVKRNDPRKYIADHADPAKVTGERVTKETIEKMRTIQQEDDRTA